MGESRYFSIRKRFIKLMPSYFISAFILCFFHPIVMAVFKHEGATAYLSIEHLFNAIGSIFFGTGMSVAYVPDIMTIGALWFIPCMMLVSVIVDFFIIRIKKDYIKGGLSVILLVAGLIIGKIIILPWSFDLALVGQFFYMVGALLKKWSEKIGGVLLKILLVVVLYVAGSLSGSLSMNERYWGLLPLSIIGAVSGSILFVIIIKNIHWSDAYVIRQIEEFGRYSLYVLCLHVLHNSFLPWGTFNLPSAVEFVVKICMLWINLKVLLWFINLLDKKIINKMEDMT